MGEPDLTKLTLPRLKRLSRSLRRKASLFNFDWRCPVCGDSTVYCNKADDRHQQHYQAIKDRQSKVDREIHQRKERA